MQNTIASISYSCSVMILLLWPLWLAPPTDWKAASGQHQTSRKERQSVCYFSIGLPFLPFLGSNTAWLLVSGKTGRWCYTNWKMCMKKSVNERLLGVKADDMYFVWKFSWRQVKQVDRSFFKYIFNGWVIAKLLIPVHSKAFSETVHHCLMLLLYTNMKYMYV